VKDLAGSKFELPDLPHARHARLRVRPSLLDYCVCLMHNQHKLNSRDRIHQRGSNLIFWINRFWINRFWIKHTANQTSIQEIDMILKELKIG